VQINTAAKKAASAAASSKKGTPRITFNLEQFERDAEAAAIEAATGGPGGGGFQPDPYDGHLNHQELTKTLLDLSALYREARRLGVRGPAAADKRRRMGGTNDRTLSYITTAVAAIVCACYCSHCLNTPFPAHRTALRLLLPLLPQVSSPHEAEFLSYYLILSCCTFGSFRASTANVVRLLNQMSADVMVSRGGRPGGDLAEAGWCGEAWLTICEAVLR
jgi:hypothetical protein